MIYIVSTINLQEQQEEEEEDDDDDERNKMQYCKEAYKHGNLKIGVSN
jgi:hypothetical protein